jgi:glycosyltransferase involved in cell wall biosynthesis
LNDHSADSASAGPMVMIDGFNLGMEKGTGVATYGRNLSFALSDMGMDVGVLYGANIRSRQDPLLQEVMFFDSDEPAHRLVRILRGARSVLSSNRVSAFKVSIRGAVVTDGLTSRMPRANSIWNARNLFQKASSQFDMLGIPTRVSASVKPGIVHWTYPLPIRMPGSINVYTLHDLVPLRLPYTTLDRKPQYLKLLKWIVRTADHIVTVSENSKRDIIDLLGVAPERVTNTYQAVSIPQRLMARDEAAVRGDVEGTFGLPYKDYFLFFGSIEPKKNIGRMIEGYLGSSADSPLVIVGARAWKSEGELSLLKSAEIRARLQVGERRGREIHRLEYVPYSLLVSLIRGAKAVLFPSLYEGFGLPVLESMMLGTPVLTSNTSSIPEVAGDAALLVDPYDTAGIAAGIRALDTDQDLRNDLTDRGRRQAALFSQEAYQRRLKGVYDSLLPQSQSQ